MTSPQAPAKRASTAPRSKATSTQVQEEPSAQNANEPVGKRVKIFWPDEKRWFTGRVTASNSKGQQHVSYDDGDKEWISLAEEQWEVLEDQSAPFSTGHPLCAVQPAQGQSPLQTS